MNTDKRIVWIYQERESWLLIVHLVVDSLEARTVDDYMVLACTLFILVLLVEYRHKSRRLVILTVV